LEDGEARNLKAPGAGWVDLKCYNVVPISIKKGTEFGMPKSREALEDVEKFGG